MFLFGASGHGKVIASIAEKKEIDIQGFFDADPNKKELSGYKVFNLVPKCSLEVIVAIGNNRIRKQIVQQYTNFIFPKLVDNSANIMNRVNIGEGTVIMPGATVNVDVEIGKHCIINTNASVDHDCILESFVHLSPNVAIAGNVTIEEGTHIGIGACVIQGIKIGKWCTIGAGTVIIKDVPDGCTVVGNPGRIIKKKNDKL